MASKVRCKRCLILDRCPHTAINRDGVCNHCEDHLAGKRPGSPHFLPLEEKQKYADELERILRTTKGDRDYDCIVGYSGGKDSIYLVHKLKRDYPNLRILAATVVMGYAFNDLALKNMEESLAKLDVDHIAIKPRISFYRKFYSYLISHRIPGGYKRGVYDSKTVTEKNAGLCFYCHEIVHDILLNYAAKHEIPLHLTGGSPGQPLYWFFAQDEDDIRQPNIPTFMQSAPFDDMDRSYCWDPGRFPGLTTYPRALFPFHVWEYNAERMREEIYQAGLISSRKNTSMFKTNCKLNFLMVYIDMKIDGYFNMLPYLSFLIRSGLADGRKLRAILFVLENFLMKRKNSAIRQLERDLGVDADEIVSKFKSQRGWAAAVCDSPT